MYLAPLNYDRYFKKVFSEKEIAKRFLEDALSVTIDEIELLPCESKITDAARSIKFDFRCKINNNHVIIEMQQWFKPDIIQRFHLYHCLNTALQLEDLPSKVVLTIENKIQETKDYSKLKPVFTIIWLVHENLSETDDYLSFVPTNQRVLDFIRDTSLWNRNNVSELKEERNKMLKKINNNTKGLLWIQENKEIFFFQKNIVKNRNNASYLPWFDFAAKTLDKTNTKEDFVEYEQDTIFKEIISRLKLQVDSREDFTYIDDYERHLGMVQLFIDSISKEARLEQQIELNKERELKEIAEAKVEEERLQKEAAEAKVEEERRQKIEAEKKAEVVLQKIKNTIMKLYKKGFSVTEISEDLEISETEIQQIVANFNK